MNTNQVILRCEDNAEAVIFHKCTYKNLIKELGEHLLTNLLYTQASIPQIKKR